MMSTKESGDDSICQRQRAYYNRIAKLYDKHYHHFYATAYRHELYDQIVGTLELKGAKVLDAMCGGGENTAYFLSRGAIVCGQDISDEQCRIYAAHYPQCRIDRSSVLETGYPDGFFDLIVVESLHHLHPRLDEGIHELSRILKPGGHLLIWEPSAGSILDLVRKIWYRLDKNYFLENEQSVDLSAINLVGRNLTLLRHMYGGNIAFLLVFSSMHFRIPVAWVGLYAKPLMWLERIINKIQGRLFACWVIALYRKRS